MLLSDERIREIIRTEAFRGEPQAEQQRWRVNEATMETIVRYCRAVETESRLQYKAALRELAATAAQHPTDPLDWPLPCDVTVGHATIHKGVTLRSLVAHMKTLYEIAARRNLIRNEQPLSFNEMTFGGCPSCGSKACVAQQCERAAPADSGEHSMFASAPSADGPQIASGAANLSEAQIASVCLSYRHDFGLLPPYERKQLMFTAREWERAFAKEHARAELEARPRASRGQAPAQQGVQRLSEQDAGLLEQAASLLEAVESDERNRGNDSTAEGTACSAHAVRRLAVTLLAAERATQPARVPRVLEDAARLEQIADAIRDYHYALDTRQHAGIAITSAFETISVAMGMSWAQGIEATRRAAMAAKADSVPEQK